MGVNTFCGFKKDVRFSVQHSLVINSNTFPVLSLVDLGSEQNLISPELVNQYHIPVHNLPTPIYALDGSSLKTITQQTEPLSFILRKSLRATWVLCISHGGITHSSGLPMASTLGVPSVLTAVCSRLFLTRFLVWRPKSNVPNEYIMTCNRSSARTWLFLSPHIDPTIDSPAKILLMTFERTLSPFSLLSAPLVSSPGS